MVQTFADTEDQQNADLVLQVSISANEKAFENVIRRNPAMCTALIDLMKDEIQVENQKAIDTSLIAAVKNLMKTKGWDATTAMNSMGIPETDQIRYASRL